MNKALIAMSGGVDSSVTAKLVKDLGFDCVGCTMVLYRGDSENDGDERACCAPDDADDARNVALGIGIPFHVFDYTDTFCEKVIDRFVQSYAQGLTPNPCIDCNRFLKFGALYQRAKELGCSHIATGHYARIEHDGDRFLLKKGLDASKDQSYVLYSLTQEQLAHTLFPLGGLTKAEVREIAEQNGFANAQKQESQDICFVPDGNYPEFIEKHVGKAFPEGDFVDPQGNVVGRHKGIVRYTVGQRKGLGVAFGTPRYVKGVDAERNTVTICEKQDLLSSTLTATEFNWTSGEVPASEVRCKAKVRYRQHEQSAVATPLDGSTVRVVFDVPLSAIACGQAVVLYDGDTVLGGGTITSVE